MTYHGSEGCQGTQGAPAAAGGAKQLPPGGQSYFLSNGWSKSIVLENRVAINFDFRSGAKKSVAKLWPQICKYVNRFQDQFSNNSNIPMIIGKLPNH